MSDFQTPLSREEAILQNMLGARNELEPPMSRTEDLLQKILENGPKPTPEEVRQIIEDYIEDHPEVLTVDTNQIIDKAVTKAKLADALLDYLLPVIEAGDEGKVLKIDEGVAKWMEGGGDISKFKFFEGIYNTSNYSIKVLAADCSEIINAFNNNYTPVIMYNISKDDTSKNSAFLIVMKILNRSATTSWIYGYSIQITSESDAPRYISFYKCDSGPVAEYKTFALEGARCFVIPVDKAPYKSSGSYFVNATLNSYAATYSWKQIKEVPKSAASDSGKILTVNSSGSPVWQTKTKELPTIAASDEGKVLKVDEGVPKWLEDQDAEIPTHTASDEGKMLSVNAQNGLEWKDVPKLPTPPSTDGTYTLQCTVSSGTPTYSWV